MAIVSEPVPVMKTEVFVATFVAPVSGVADKYGYSFYKNGTVQNLSPGGSLVPYKEVPATTVSVSLSIPVVNGDIIAVRVTPVNASGKGSTVEEQVVVDWLPEIPGEMGVVITY